MGAAAREQGRQDCCCVHRSGAWRVWEDGRKDKDGLEIHVMVDGVEIDTAGSHYSSVDGPDDGKILGLSVTPETYRPFKWMTRQFDASPGIQLEDCAGIMINTIVVDMYRFKSEAHEVSVDAFNSSVGDPSTHTFNVERRQSIGEVGVGFADEPVEVPGGQACTLQEGDDYLESDVDEFDVPRYRFIIVFGSEDWLKEHGYPIQEFGREEAQKAQPKRPAKRKEFPRASQSLPTPESESAPGQTNQIQVETCTPRPGAVITQAQKYRAPSIDDLYQVVPPSPSAPHKNTTIRQNTPVARSTEASHQRHDQTVSSSATASRSVGLPRTGKGQDKPAVVKEEQVELNIRQEDSAVIDLTLDSEDEDDKRNVVNHVVRARGPGSSIESGLRTCSSHDDSRSSASASARGIKRRVEQVEKVETTTGMNPDSKRARVSHSASSLCTAMSPRMQLDFDILQNTLPATETEVNWARTRTIALLHCQGDQHWGPMMRAIMASERFDKEVREEVEKINSLT